MQKYTKPLLLTTIIIISVILSITGINKIPVSGNTFTMPENNTTDQDNIYHTYNIKNKENNNNNMNTYKIDSQTSGNNTDNNKYNTNSGNKNHQDNQSGNNIINNNNSGSNPGYATNNNQNNNSTVNNNNYGNTIGNTSGNANYTNNTPGNNINQQNKISNQLSKNTNKQPGKIPSDKTIKPAWDKNKPGKNKLNKNNQPRTTSQAFKNNITKIEFLEYFIKLPVGKTTDILFKTTPRKSMPQEFIYKSADTSVARFNNQKLAGIKKGFTTIIVMLPDGSIKAACPVKII